MKKLLLLLLLPWSLLAQTATVRNADYSEAGSGTSVTLSTGGGHTAAINAAGDLIVFGAWCFQTCTPGTLTMGSQTATRTSVGTPGTTVGTDGNHTGQFYIYYILSSTQTGNQTITWNATGASGQLQVSYIDFGITAGFHMIHHVDSSAGTGANNGVANLPSISGVTGDVLFGVVDTGQHVNPSVNSPWSCPTYSGSGETQTCQFNTTINGQAYILSAASGTTSMNWTLINSSIAWESIISSFSFVSNTPNACPSGANFVNPNNPVGALVTLASIGVTTCYFVANNGLDTNTGADEQHPWLFSPGMHNCASNCAALTLAPNKGIIFRGGDTWHFGNSGAVPYAGVVTGCAINGTQAAGLCIDAINGTSSNPIFYGVDANWFAGASWTRPILTADNPLCNSGTAGILPDGATCTNTTDSFSQPSNFVSACGFQVGTANNLVDIGFSKFIIFDNFELTGLCQSHTGQPGGEDSYINYQGPQANIWIMENYIHGASHLHWAALNGSAGCTGSTVCINLNAFYGGNGPGNDNILLNVVDFSDSDPIGENLCQCSFYNIAYNEFNYTTQAIPGKLHDFHDNIYENFFENGHSNVIEDAETSPIGVIYNNIFRHIEKFVSAGGGVLLWPGPTGSGDHNYTFNNLIYDVGVVEYFNMGGIGITTNSGGYVIFNNTFQINSSGAILRCELATGSVLDTNNHYIDNGNYLNGGCTPTTLSANVMTNSVATTNGYTSSQTFAFSPTSSSSPTVATGANEFNGYAATLLASSDAFIQAAGNAARSDTTYALTYNTSNHTVSWPARTVVARPTSGAWDAGTYQFSSSSGAPNPVFNPTSLSFVNQLVNTSSSQQSTVLTNNGTVALTISSISITGTNAGDFSQNNNCPGSLGTGLNCTINVVFTPPTTGSRSANISVADNASGSPQLVPLSGTGVQPIATLNASAANFFNQFVGTTTSIPILITLTNTGTAALNITSILMGGTNSGDFGQVNNCPASLGISSFCTITLTFSPSVLGQRTASVSITDSAPGSPHVIALSGNGAHQISGVGSIGGTGIIKVGP